jgi:hypothetical protein
MASNTKRAIADAEHLKAAAAAGDPAAMWNYALLVLGERPPADGRHKNPLPFLIDVAAVVTRTADPQAKDLITRAAQAGNTQAMVVLADLVEKSDPQQARDLLERAAAGSDPAGMLYLGGMLESTDQAAAARWFTRLAELGDDLAMYQLAELARASDPASAQAWLAKAADAGNVRAQNDVAVLAGESGRGRLDPSRPPAIDPRRTGIFNASNPTSRQQRVVADCVKCRRKTVQDHYEVMVGRWFGVRGPTTAGKTGTKFHFSVCTICACLFPIDDATREYARSKGGEFFNPAKLLPH